MADRLPTPSVSANEENMDMAPPTPGFMDSGRERDRDGLPRSRPLSEISDNSVKFRRTSGSIIVKSRPNSEVREDPKRVPSMAGLESIKTITLNLSDYAASPAMKSPVSTSSAGSSGPPPSIPSTKPGGRPSLPVRRSTSGKEKEGVEGDGTVSASASTAEDAHVSPLLVSKRLSLRPSPLSASYADVTKPIPSPPLSSTSADSSASASTSDPTIPPKPVAKSKPSWLRRASGNAARTKSKSPAPAEEATLQPAPQPPSLPPRNGKGKNPDGIAEMAPPELPRRSSYASVAASGPSRSNLGDGEGQPAFLPAPPPLPSRENVGNIRTRLAAWTSAAQSSSGFSRSESSNSFASITTTNSFSSSAQRIPASAQRVLGHAGSAVQKGWAGLRSRGVGGSISSMSSLAGSSGRRGNLDPSPSWSSGLNRWGSRDLLGDMPELVASQEGPLLTEGCIKRKAGAKSGRVFGTELEVAAKAWGVEGAHQAVAGMSGNEQRRRASLPAVVVRAVEYLEIWGPKEEGIFRISGRASHLARLRKEFDAGADIDLRECHPADLDPHAVSGIFKQYLRELPSPLLTSVLTPKFEDYVRTRSSSKDKGKTDDLAKLLDQLPICHWFLLADIVKLLILVPAHADVNRMTLNALMLSLGPSLNISGGVIAELIERHEELFKAPPSAEPKSSASTAPPVDHTVALIDFGDVDIEPPSIPPSVASRPVTALSIRSEESHATTSQKSDGSSKKKPILPKKPSITRLLSDFSNKSLGQKGPVQSAALPLSATPPRVDIAIEASSPLPSFEIDSPSKAGSSKEAKSEVMSEVKTSVVDLGISNLDNAEPKFSSATDLSDHRPSLAALSEPTTPTPIADRFSRTSADYPSLRGPSAAAMAFAATLGDPIAPNGTHRRRGGSNTFFSASLASSDRLRPHSVYPSIERKKSEEMIGPENVGERRERFSAGSDAGQEVAT